MDPKTVDEIDRALCDVESVLDNSKLLGWLVREEEARTAIARIRIALGLASREHEHSC